MHIRCYIHNRTITELSKSKVLFHMVVKSLVWEKKKGGWGSAYTLKVKIKDLFHVIWCIGYTMLAPYFSKP